MYIFCNEKRQKPEEKKTESKNNNFHEAIQNEIALAAAHHQQHIRMRQYAIITTLRNYGYICDVIVSVSNTHILNIYVRDTSLT